MTTWQVNRTLLVLAIAQLRTVFSNIWQDWQHVGQKQGKALVPVHLPQESLGLNCFSFFLCSVQVVEKGGGHMGPTPAELVRPVP